MALLNNLKRIGNWGWPEGMQTDLSFLEEMIGKLNPQLNNRTGQRIPLGQDQNVYPGIR